MTSGTGNNPARGDHSGFVFAELLVVVVISAIILAAAVPLLSGSWREASFRASARNTVALLNHARRSAAMKGKTLRAVFDLTENKVWLEQMTGNDSFERDRSSSLTELSLSDGVSFFRIEGPGIEPESKKVTASFFPDGTAESRKIIIKSKANAAYEITINPAAGTVSAKQL